MSSRRGVQKRDAGGKREKKAGKAAYQPTTYEELMEAAVELEEKAERFGHGAKAQRYYEDCLKLYERAGALEPSFDAQYNSARVQYQLSTSFHIPPAALLGLRSAIARYRACLPSAPDEIAREDTAYNLAQALLDLADMGEAFPYGVDVQEGTRSRVEAVQLLQNCLTYEEKSLQNGAQDQVQQEAPVSTNEDDTMHEDDGESAIEQHVPTVGSCLDTALLLVDACTDIWAQANVWPATQEQQVVRDVLQRVANFNLDPNQRASLQLAELEVDVLLDQLAFETDRDADASAARLQALLARPLEAPTPDQANDDSVRIRVDIHTAQADLRAALATRLLRSQSTNASRLAQVWTQLSQGITLLNRAVELPIPPLTMPLAKSALLNDVSELSLRRAALAPLGHPPAQKSESQLLANAVVYANRALAEGGWGYLCTQAVRTGALGATAVAMPGIAGYIKEELMEKAILTLCRSLGAQMSSTSTIDKAAAENKLQELLKKTREMSRARGRLLDHARVQNYLEEVDREGGPLAGWEQPFWQSVAGQLGGS